MLNDILDAVANLRMGRMLSMPLSKTMPNIGKGVYELRIKDRLGHFRVIYVIKVGDAIYLIHAFKKKTPKTPQKVIETVKKRIRKL